MESKLFLLTTDNLSEHLDEYASRMKEVSVGTVEAHLANPRMQAAGGWDVVVSGYDVVSHIVDTFELYKMNPQRVAATVAANRAGAGKFDDLQIMLNPVRGLSDDDVARRTRSAIEEIYIELSHSTLHDPPEDVDSLKLQTRLGSEQTNYGRHERVHELRVFLNHSDFGGRRVRHQFAVATYRKDAERVLRKCEYYPVIRIGWDGTSVDFAEWIKKDRARQDAVKAQRREAGDCIMCGQPLGRMQRLLSRKHKQCQEFLAI